MRNTPDAHRFIELAEREGASLTASPRRRGTASNPGVEG
jgi:hypothetical protein